MRIARTHSHGGATVTALRAGKLSVTPEEPSHRGVTIPYISRRSSGTIKTFLLCCILLGRRYWKFAKKATINYLFIRNDSSIAKDIFRNLDFGEFNQNLNPFIIFL